jgi:hypothetical protein
MTKLGAFLESIRDDARVVALVTAAGLITALAPSVATATEPHPKVESIVIHDLDIVNDLNERISDQLNSMKPLSAALRHSVSYGSPTISGIQKAKNLAMAFEFSMQQASHSGYAEADRYFLNAGQATHVTQELRDMVEIVNAKKQELMEFTATLSKIESALVNGDGRSLEVWIDRLSKMADGVEEKLHSDISVGYEEDFSNPLDDTI